MTIKITPELDAETVSKIRERNVMYAKKWREKNAEKAKRTVSCECGSTYLYSNTTHHMRSNKHKQWTKTQEMIKEIQELKSKLATI